MTYGGNAYGNGGERGGERGGAMFQGSGGGGVLREAKPEANALPPIRLLDLLLARHQCFDMKGGNVLVQA